MNDDKAKTKKPNREPSPFIIDMISDYEKAGNPLPPLVEVVPHRPLTRDEMDEQYRKWEKK